MRAETNSEVFDQWNCTISTNFKTKTFTEMTWNGLTLYSAITRCHIFFILLQHNADIKQVNSDSQLNVKVILIAMVTILKYILLN